MKQDWRKEFVPGARVKIKASPCGIGDVGAVLVVDRIEDNTLSFHYAEGVWIEKGGERFPLWEMFAEGQCTADAFGDGSIEWEIVA